MSVNDNCAWPHCQQLSAMAYNKKSLCEKHLALVLSETPRVSKKAMQQLNMPELSLIRGREFRTDESPKQCAHSECKSRATYLFEHRVPVCGFHMTAAQDIKTEEPVVEYVFDDDFDLEGL